MNKLSKVLEKRWASYTVAVCSGVLLYVLLMQISPILLWIRSTLQTLSPIVIGLAMAYVVDPIAVWLERGVFRKIRMDTARRTVAVLCTIIIVLLLVALFIGMVVPSIIHSITGIVENLDGYYLKAKELIERINEIDFGVELNIDLDQLIVNAESRLQEALDDLEKTLLFILGMAGDVGNTVFNVAIGFIIAIYFLGGKSGLVGSINRLRRAAMPSARYKKDTSFWQRCHEIFIQYIGCNLLDGTLVASANAVFMLICGMPNVALVSVVVGVTNLVPTFGPIVGFVIGSVLLVLTKPAYALWFMIFTIILQTLDGYVVKPVLYGDSLGVPAVWTLIAIIVGGKIGGMLGMLLAIPIVAVITMLYRERFLPWLRARNPDPEPEPDETITEEEIAEKTDQTV